MTPNVNLNLHGNTTPANGTHGPDTMAFACTERPLGLIVRTPRIARAIFANFSTVLVDIRYIARALLLSITHKQIWLTLSLYINLAGRALTLFNPSPCPNPYPGLSVSCIGRCPYLLVSFIYRISGIRVLQVSMSSSIAPTSVGKQSATMVGTTNAANSAKQQAAKMHRRSRNG
jgi:hypothetical protein